MMNYACRGCYVAAHDPSFTSPHVEYADVWATDWACPEHVESEDVCPNCEDSFVEYGITCGGQCDLGRHGINGYWEYHVFTA